MIPEELVKREQKSIFQNVISYYKFKFKYVVILFGYLETVAINGIIVFIASLTDITWTQAERIHWELIKTSWSQVFD